MTCAAPVVRCRIVEIVRTVHRNFCHPSTSRRDKGAADQRAPGVAWTSSRASPAAAGETDGGSGASPSEMTEDSLRFDVRTAPSCHAVVDPDAPYWDWGAIEVALRVPARGQRRGSRFKRACHRGHWANWRNGVRRVPKRTRLFGCLASNGSAHVATPGTCMELRQLRYFMAIADQGSLSSAVGVLNVAQAALPSAISFAPWRRSWALSCSIVPPRASSPPRQGRPSMSTLRRS